MTIEEMHDNVQLRVQKIDSNSYENILDEEVDVYLNKAIDQFIKDRLEPRSNRFGLGFEQSVKRTEDLRTLIKRSEVDTEEVTTDVIEGVFIDSATIPADFMYPINIALKIQYNDEGVTFTTPSTKRVVAGVLDTDYAEKRVPSKVIQHDDILYVVKDPFNKPSLSSGVVTIDNDKIYSYTDNRFITDKIVINYIRQPVTVSLSGTTDCDLSTNTHQEIVDIAAKLILSDIEALGKAQQVESLNDLE